MTYAFVSANDIRYLFYHGWVDRVKVKAAPREDICHLLSPFGRSVLCTDAVLVFGLRARLGVLRLRQVLSVISML